MKNENLIARAWNGYELLDSGENMKLERYGDVLIARPETQALWQKRKPQLWNDAQAEFSWSENKGSWRIEGTIPDPWVVSWEDVSFIARLTSFKHTGIFPEQAPNWRWSAERIAALLASRGTAGEAGIEKPRVLNLFGYTGIATIVAAKAGALVTHADASKQSVAWARENARASGLPEDAIRWIVEDALAFAKREVRRGSKYDGIILDPPAFGRGAKGEVWHIEEQLPELMAALHELLSDSSGSFFLMNGYAAGYAPESFKQLAEDSFGIASGAASANTPDSAHGEYGELQIAESGSDRIVPSGIYVRFTR